MDPKRNGKKYRCKTCGCKILDGIIYPDSIEVQCHRCHAVFVGFKTKPSEGTQAAVDIARGMDLHDGGEIKRSN